MEEKIEMYKRFCDREFKSAKRACENGWYTNKAKTLYSYLQRCLGVADFLQDMGVPFEVVNKIYEEYHAKIDDLYLEENKNV